MTRNPVLGILAWLILSLVATLFLAYAEHERLKEKLAFASEVLYREISVRVSQHDAHLTSLSALAVAGKTTQLDLFLEVAGAIKKFYPRVVAVDLVPLLNKETYITTRRQLATSLSLPVSYSQISFAIEWEFKSDTIAYVY